MSVAMLDQWRCKDPAVPLSVAFPAAACKLPLLQLWVGVIWCKPRKGDTIRKLRCRWATAFHVPRPACQIIYKVPYRHEP